VVTDDEEYFAAMQVILRHAPANLRIDSESHPTELPPTTFEERFRANGAKLRQFTVRKTSE